MAVGNGKPGVKAAESREEAIEAMASALEFLRREAASLGLHEVSDMLSKARVRIRRHDAPAPIGSNRH